ncbi:MAG: hypothetical protein JJU22_18830, partial [Gammaproteobacteria bacterium]|nr:hypothetical protein [Gammaproteobacteria bacterium]
ERYFAQRNAPICIAFIEGHDLSSGQALRDRPNRFAIRAFPQGCGTPLSEGAISRREMIH